MKISKVTWSALLFFFVATAPVIPGQATNGKAPINRAKSATTVRTVRQINPTTFEVIYADSTRLSIDFYSDHIVRLFQDNQGGIIRNPKATPPAQILVDNPRKAVGDIDLMELDYLFTITSNDVEIVINKENGLFTIHDLKKNKPVVSLLQPIDFTPKAVELKLEAQPDEYFYGGGVQNGRFSHKGKLIAIENTNNWTDGGVASPTPFYWSTGGYGVMWHTFKKGKYDFGADVPNEVKLMHETDYLDLFVMINDTPVALLNDFYQLTGHPVLIPKFGFYQGHLNAYNRDYWAEDENGILFEDGKRYKESQKDNGGVKESLNGELDNYQFSARAVIDRYHANDMPLGWVLSNDGYGAGYGQTGTLDGNIQNLKEFGDYARAHGVEIGLWTQSDLHPKPGIEALLQRDIVKEVRDAGVNVLKTDVAWVGAGYSFGLNGVADVANIMPYYGNNARPFIISLDGWAGTQRYATIWSGDQTGGEWEYIRFHIPTYIGSGLSGQPNISSDMDGIFGGKNVPVNVRDFQWKTFTPMQLNMDGWGANPKYPHILDEPATSINRWYLKLKSELMPYAYTIAQEAIDGKPMIRAMFLDYDNEYTLGTATRYQFLYGPSILVAPIYQNTKMDEAGNDIRNGIYLPEGNWVDYFTGEEYQGGCVVNHFDAPLWKLPIFIKRGAIIPMTNPNNNPKEMDKHQRIYELYPFGESSFTEYDDDGLTEAYRLGQSATTVIGCNEQNGNVTITIQPTKGGFDGMEYEKSTLLRINTTAQPKKISANVGGKKLQLTEVYSLDDLNGGENVYYYEEYPNMNQFATPGTPFAEVVVTKNPVIHVKLAATDVTANEVRVELKGYEYNLHNQRLQAVGELTTPEIEITEEAIAPYAMTLSWKKVDNADYYEIDFNGMYYTHIMDTCFLFQDLDVLTDYTFKVRAINQTGASDWGVATAKTKSNPLEFAIKGIVGETSCDNQPGQNINRLFNFDEKDSWHTKWQAKAVPFDVIMDLRSYNVLDKFQYLPRTSRGNGIWQQGTVYYSMDKKEWHEAGSFEWEGTDARTFVFENQPTARYIKVAISKAIGEYGSGRELYVFKVKGSASYLPGDINLDGKIDENDLTSYLNYTGLRTVDSDFDYISKGDLNNNGLIDAYDISEVATKLDGGVSKEKDTKLDGAVTFVIPKKSYQVGEVAELIVKGVGLQSVNAISLAIPYDAQSWEVVGVEAPLLNGMRNMTNDRLHSNGEKSLYPTFVNIGDKETINGNVDLMTIRLKTKRKGVLNIKPTNGVIVDKNMNAIEF